MGKEKGIGILIFILAFLVLIYYTWGLVILQNPWFGQAVQDWVLATFAAGLLRDIFLPDPMFLIILPVWLAAVLIAVIAMWIGWTMITTPAPEPLEDFDFEEEKVPRVRSLRRRSLKRRNPRKRSPRVRRSRVIQENNPSHYRRRVDLVVPLTSFSVA
jgi:hypothetical protein